MKITTTTIILGREYDEDGRREPREGGDLLTGSLTSAEGAELAPWWMPTMELAA